MPLYTQADADAVLNQFRTVEAHQKFDPARRVTAEFRYAGHILAPHSCGSCVGTSITFSGDIGRNDDVLMEPPESPVETDYLVIESTYGNRLIPGNRKSQPGWLAAQGMDRGGVTVIPGFAIGRAQALLWQISRLKAGEIPDVPVYVDSPMAKDATKLYHEFHQLHRLDEAQSRRMCAAAKFINTPDESKWLDRQPGPMIIISASGMATGGRVLHHLKAFAVTSATWCCLPDTRRQAHGARQWWVACRRSACTARISHPRRK